MSITYTPATNFGAKDSLPTNDPDKVIKGSEFTTEFTAIQTAFGLAAPAASPTFTGTVTIASVDINGGNIDGTTIGGTTPAAGTFSSLTATTADINGGTIDGVTIGGSSAGAITGTTGQFNTSLNVDGTITADGLETLSTSGDIGYRLGYNAGTSAYIHRDSATGHYLLQSDETGASWKIETDDGAGPLTRAEFTRNGDISFYEDTGTTPKFFWDASAEALGIGTTSPQQLLHLSALNPGAKIRLEMSQTGVASDDVTGEIEFYHNDSSGAGVNANIKGICTNSVGAGALTFGTGTTSATERMRIDSSGNVGINNTVASSMDGGANNLVVGSGSGTEGITIYSGTVNSGTIYFADGTSGDDRFRGQIGYSHSDNAFSFRTNASSTSNMTLDSSGNLGLGVTPGSFDSSYRALQIGTTANFMGAVSGDGNWISNNAIFSAGAWNYIQTAAASSLDMQSGTAPFRFRYAASGTAGNAISWSEAMRIDSSGNLLVGTTNAVPLSDDGAVLGASGYVYASRDGDIALFANRLTSDGDIAVFRKDGTTVGSIQSRAGLVSTIILDPRSGSLGTGLTGSGANLSPTNGSGTEVDARNDIGTATYRFKDLYLSGGVYLGGTGADNLLDDYEEGTWTPVLHGDAGQSGQTYSSQLGTYTKIGRQVTCRFNLRLTAEGTFTNTYILLAGLPFTSASSPGAVQAGNLYFVSMDTNFISIGLQIDEGTSKAYLWAKKSASASREYVGLTDLTDTTQLTGTFTYFI